MAGQGKNPTGMGSGENEKLTKGQIMKEVDNLDFIKIASLCFKEHLQESEKTILQNGNKYFQIVYLMRDCIQGV